MRGHCVCGVSYLFQLFICLRNVFFGLFDVDIDTIQHRTLHTTRSRQHGRRDQHSTSRLFNTIDILIARGRMKLVITLECATYVDYLLDNERV